MPSRELELNLRAFGFTRSQYNAFFKGSCHNCLTAENVCPRGPAELMIG